MITLHIRSNAERWNEDCSCYHALRGKNLNIKFDKYSLIINGKREFILAGAFHYFRLPAREMWRERLLKMKEAGLNAVDIYFPWNYHSEQEGKYDFSGIRDVEYLMNIIEELGLYLIARPGPYICAEIDAGGFPGWLLTKNDVILRCRENGKIKYSYEYMKYVKEWFSQIVPKIAKRNNLLLFQIENEFNLSPHTRGFLKPVVDFICKNNPNLLLDIMSNDIFKYLMFKLMPSLTSFSSQFTASKIIHNEYMIELYKMARKMGINVPIFHNDIMSLIERQIDVDIISIDDYSITAFKRDWRNNKYTFAGIDIFEKGHDNFQKNSPIFAAEFQGSWFDSWGGYGYEYIRKMLGTDQLDIATKSALAQRTTAINYFMFCGSTTWGYLGSPDVYTSYDMAAPISEDGKKTERFYVIKWLAKMLKELGEDFLCTDADNAVKITASNKNIVGATLCGCPKDIFIKSRKSKNKKYVFLRNLTNKSHKVKLNICKDIFINLASLEMKILVFDNKNNLEKEFGKYSGSLSISQSSNPQSNSTVSEHCRTTCAVTPNLQSSNLQLPAFVDWTLSYISPQIMPDYDDSNWTEVEFTKRMDIDSLGLHYGYVWYRGLFDKSLKKIKIDARHCYSIFVNGILLTSKDNFKNVLPVGSDCAENYEFEITENLLNNGENVISILVESLGHNKDFEYDARNPRGIVSIETYGSQIKWKVRGGLIEGEKGLCPILDVNYFKNLQKSRTIVKLPHQWDKSEAVRFIEPNSNSNLPTEGVYLYQTEFQLLIETPNIEVVRDFSPVNSPVNLEYRTQEMNSEMPPLSDKNSQIGLVIQEAHSKANIYLNGYLIGRYWQEKGPQKKFYLPNGLLKYNDKNHLAIAVWKRWGKGGLGKLYIEKYGGISDFTVS